MDEENLLELFMKRLRRIGSHVAAHSNGGLDATELERHRGIRRSEPGGQLSTKRSRRVKSSPGQNSGVSGFPESDRQRLDRILNKLSMEDRDWLSDYIAGRHGKRRPIDSD